MELQLSLLLLLLLSSHGLRATEGRALHPQLNDPHPPKVSDLFRLLDQPSRARISCCSIGDGAAAVAESLIGSRPPRCEGKCATCGRCEAVQVPVAPRVDGSRGEAVPGRSRAAGGGDRVQESYTDYKPLNWKCRCADWPALDP
ncbi:hypothetical protein HU200_048166 [Digitaria exilis]|uniref:Epidermal patterning factor-like protein n=1 Tax=Digitaria exilis TaxID=1010633 RepID=A0A835AVR0_9POAL|nr:hypothetical protein HU200_048166 [Digitaria exilis]